MLAWFSIVRRSLIKLIFTIIFNILDFEENWKCFHSSYIPVNESNKCKKRLSVVQLGNQNSAHRFNDMLQNKWHILYCNVSTLLQFTIYVFTLIPMKHSFWEIAVTSISLDNIPFLLENQNTCLNQSLYLFWTLAFLFKVFLDSS